MQFSDSGLLSLVDLKRDKYVAWLALIVVDSFGFDLRLQKAVRKIERMDRIAVALHHLLAEFANGQEALFLNLQPAGQQIVAEVLVAADPDAYKPVFHTANHLIFDYFFMRLRVLARCIGHLGVEISIVL